MVIHINRDWNSSSTTYPIIKEIINIDWIKSSSDIPE